MNFHYMLEGQHIKYGKTWFYTNVSKQTWLFTISYIQKRLSVRICTAEAAVASIVMDGRA